MARLLFISCPVSGKPRTSESRNPERTEANMDDNRIQLTQNRTLALTKQVPMSLVRGLRPQPRRKLVPLSDKCIALDAFCSRLIASG